MLHACDSKQLRQFEYLTLFLSCFSNTMYSIKVYFLIHNLIIIDVGDSGANLSYETPSVVLDDYGNAANESYVHEPYCTGELTSSTCTFNYSIVVETNWYDNRNHSLTPASSSAVSLVTDNTEYSGTSLYK